MESRIAVDLFPDRPLSAKEISRSLQPGRMFLVTAISTHTYRIPANDRDDARTRFLAGEGAFLNITEIIDIEEATNE